MKPSVSNPIGTFIWGRSAYSASRSRRFGGRFGWLPDLNEAVLPIAGLILLAEVLSLFHLGLTLQFLVAGSAFGAVIGKTIVVWRERSGDALPPERVRRIECSWILLGATVMLLLAVLA